MVFVAEDEVEASGNSSPTGGKFLSPSGENGSSRGIKIQENDDSAENVSDSGVKIEASEEALEGKVSDGIDGSGSVADGSSGDEENEVEGDSLEKEESSEEESKANENSVAEEYFSNAEEDEVNGESEPLTSQNAQEQSSHEEEELNDGDSEHSTSNNVTSSATEEEHSGKEEHRESEPLTSPKVTNEEASLEHSDKNSSKATESHNTSRGSPELKHSASVESFVSISSDVEGENLVDVLKQQLEHDRKRLKGLSKELEEERNASTIAANQAMAMITRLQEEKAALHMEALQYLRMMDEQAEHDVDALERANDVLADREKEIQDLEMELEYYRVKYPDEPRDEILASMGILGDVETSGVSTTDETTDKAPTDTKLTDSPSPEV